MSNNPQMGRRARILALCATDWRTARELYLVGEWHVMLNTIRNTLQKLVASGHLRRRSRAGRVHPCYEYRTVPDMPAPRDPLSISSSAVAARREQVRALCQNAWRTVTEIWHAYHAHYHAVCRQTIYHYVRALHAAGKLERRRRSTSAKMKYEFRCPEPAPMPMPGQDTTPT